MTERPDMDQRERALTHRLELSKERLSRDIGKLSTLLGSSANDAVQRFVRVGLLVGGFLLVGIATAVLIRRRHAATKRFF